jgi:predicted Ser/Thr protein kinase
MIGTQIANYRIEETLGRGGMGTVYKAMDVALDRPVAIKVLSSELAHDPALIARFRAEAKAQANLSHTNVATLYSFLDVGGSCFIVMEYVEGETLDEIIRFRGRLAPEEAIPLFKQALLGIAAAHRRGIIHRDIKPGNIMVARNGIVKVMDFGIAKVLTNDPLTRTGSQLGTVTHMSPEQICRNRVDVRADIYSLGVTLYSMLTGRLPFESENAFRVMSDHVNTPPPQPSCYVPNLPRGIEKAVLKALEKKPEARFQTVEEFGAALEEPQGGQVASTVAVENAASERALIALPVQRSPEQGRFRGRQLFQPAGREEAGNVPVVPGRMFLGGSTGFRTQRARFFLVAYGVLALFLAITVAALEDSPAFIIGFAVVLYFLPILVAAIRHKANGAWIVKVNALLGWTVLWWIVAMRQALSDE